MILIAHLLFGAAIGSIVKNPFLAIPLAFLCHYLLDLIPHIEYSVKNIENKQWQKASLDFLKVGLDFFFGIVFIAIFSSNQAIVYICALFAALPDGLSVLDLILNNKLLEIHSNLHRKRIHFLKHKKIPTLWKTLSQVSIVVLSVILLRI